MDLMGIYKHLKFYPEAPKNPYKHTLDRDRTNKSEIASDDYSEWQEASNILKDLELDAEISGAKERVVQKNETIVHMAAHMRSFDEDRARTKGRKREEKQQADAKSKEDGSMSNQMKHRQKRPRPKYQWQRRNS